MSDDDHELTELAVALDRLGSKPVEVSPDRLDALEARVLAGMNANADDRRGGTVVPFAQRRRPLGALALGAVAASVLAIALLVGFFAAEDDGLVIAAADGVEIVLPGGDVVAGVVGQELPNGAEIDVTGFVEIDGTRYGAGTYEVIDDEVRRVVEGVEGVEGNGGDSVTDPGASSGDGNAPTVIPPSTNSTTTSTSVPTRPSAPSTAPRPVEDDKQTRPTSTALESDWPQRPTTTVRSEPVDTRPVLTTTSAPRPVSTDASTRTTTTSEPARERPVEPAGTTTTVRSRPDVTTTSLAPTTTATTTPTTARERRPNEP